MARVKHVAEEVDDYDCLFWFKERFYEGEEMLLFLEDYWHEYYFYGLFCV